MPSMHLSKNRGGLRIINRRDIDDDRRISWPDVELFFPLVELQTEGSRLFLSSDSGETWSIPRSSR